MKKGLIFFSIGVLLSALLFWLGNAMTPRPGVSSGNGNPAILLFIVLIPLFFMMIFILASILKKVTIPRKIQKMGIGFIILHWAIGVIYQMRDFSRHKQVLAEAYKEKFGFIDWEYINSITSGIDSIHMNSQFFNLNTFLLFLSLIILLGWLSKGWILLITNKVAIRYK